MTALLVSRPDDFNGHRRTDMHRSVGRRAWCLKCGEWCTQNVACPCCIARMAEESPCPHCGGTGVAS